MNEKNNQNKDPKEALLAEAARRAHDEELQALANLAIIRSSINGRKDRPERIKNSPADLEERLRNIIEDSDA